MLFPNSDDYHSYGEQTNAYFQWWDNNDLKVNLQVIVRRSRLLNHGGLGKGNSGHNIGFAAPVKGRVGDTGRRAFDLPPFLVFRFVFLQKFFDGIRDCETVVHVGCLLEFTLAQEAIDVVTRSRSPSDLVVCIIVDASLAVLGRDELEAIIIYEDVRRSTLKLIC